VGAFFFAVADEKEFLSNFKVVRDEGKIKEIHLKVPSGNAYCLAFRNGYAVLSHASESSAVEAALEAKQSIAAEMAGLESWLAENDGTVVGTAAGIKYAAKQAGEELKKSNEDLGKRGEVPIVTHALLDLYAKALEAVPNEVSLALAGIRCDKAGSIRILGRARLASGGQVSKAIAGIPPLTGNLLSGVPGGPFVSAAGGVSVPSLVDGCIDRAMGIVKGMKPVAGLSAEDVQRTCKVLFDIVQQVRGMGYVMKSGRTGDPIYSNMFYTMRVDSSSRVLELLEELTKIVNKLIQDAKPEMLKSITVKRLEIAGKPALQEEVNFDLPNIAGPAANRAILDEMLGIGGKMLVYHVAADDRTVLMGIGVSQERMAAALDVLKQPRKSLAEDADVSITAAMLPPQSQWVAYVSPRGYVQLTQRMMTAMMKNSPVGERFSLPQFPKSPPVGFAIKATPTEVQAEIAVPPALIQAGGDYVKDMQKAFLEQNETPAP
jgi:hypothetical protein